MVGNLRNQIVHWALMDARRHIDWRLLISLGTILLIILVIALLGGFSGLGGGPFYGTGYYGGGGLGLVLVIVLILVLLGRI
jgi:Zn-dependent protease with chaperone function